MPDFHEIRHLLPELENRETVEQYRHWRQPTHSHAKALNVPPEVTRVYRGVWGDNLLAAPLVGPALALPEQVSGMQDSAAYTPVWFRGEVRIDHRRLFRSDQWNTHLTRAVFDSVPPPQGRRPQKELWCLLLVHEFTTKTRTQFWLNPLDSSWDGQREVDVGRTFYTEFTPIQVSAAYVRLHLLKGTMKTRGSQARSLLKRYMTSLAPPDEWVPPERAVPAKTRVTKPPKRTRKLPSKYLQAARGS